jgi:hypothetical protein
MKRMVVLIAMLFVIVIACKHEMPVIPGTNPGGGSGGTGGTGGSGGSPGSATSEIYFEKDVLPIFQNSCATTGVCHSEKDAQKGYILNSYTNIMNSNKSGMVAGDPEKSMIYKMITEKDPAKRMPKGSPALDTAKIGLIKRWIAEGAKNTSSCDTTRFAYSAAIKPIIDSNCVKCHNGGPAAPASLNYTTYEGLRTVALNGRLLGAITHSPGFSPMPKNSPQLSDCKVTQIKKWIQAGAPNN